MVFVGGWVRLIFGGRFQGYVHDSFAHPPIQRVPDFLALKFQRSRQVLVVANYRLWFRF